MNHPDELADHSVMVLGHRTGNGDLYVVTEPNQTGVTGLSSKRLTHGDLPVRRPRSQQPGDVHAQRNQGRSQTARR
ncbi:MAG: hypothetical protein U0872_12870 [Planctomycetaceae bacterium]